MDKETFDRLVRENVAAGASREDSIAYIVAGYKISAEEAKKLTGESEKRKAKGKK